MKKVTKKFKPVYVIDWTDCETVEDALYETIWTKIEAGVDIPAYQVALLIDMEIGDAIDDALDELFDGAELIAVNCLCAQCECKKPWYKRFWNWITRKK